MENVPMHGERPNVAGRRGKLKKFKMKHIAMAVVAAVVIIVLLLGGLFLYRSSTGANIESDKFQAVFLTNGQVYFGKLQTLNSEYMKINNIFYLQTKAAASSTNPQKTSDQSATDVQLIKLGSEIHGPEDQMIISKTQILFFENLKSDGTVSKTIQKYNSQK